MVKFLDRKQLLVFLVTYFAPRVQTALLDVLGPDHGAGISVGLTSSCPAELQHAAAEKRVLRAG